MAYQALATDYDGTLANDGKVDEATVFALNRWQAAGRKLILVTGRQLEELYSIFPESDYCDAIVAENGAVLYLPTTKECQLLGTPPPTKFIKMLQSRQVEPLVIGKGLLATWTPHDITIQAVIEELDLPWQVILNKGAVMALPQGVNKASGLQVALKHLGLSAAETVAVGDAENDLDFFRVCGLSVAVANALPIVIKQAQWTTQGSRGKGVVELIAKLLD